MVVICLTRTRRNYEAVVHRTNCLHLCMGPVLSNYKQTIYLERPRGNVNLLDSQNEATVLILKKFIAIFLARHTQYYLSLVACSQLIGNQSLVLFKRAYSRRKRSRVYVF